MHRTVVPVVALLLLAAGAAAVAASAESPGGSAADSGKGVAGPAGEAAPDSGRATPPDPARGATHGSARGQGPAERVMERTAETRSEVAELTAYHEVIREIWHEARPKKDVVRLRALLPEVLGGAHAVANASLPGILRDRRAAWNEGVVALMSAAGAYRSAADSKDDRKLLDAAEDLHARFEALDRIVRPVLPEMDEFHAVLYVIYHKQLPAYDMAGIERSAGRLATAMVALNAAKLPKRFERKEKAFVARRKDLSESVDALLELVAEGNRDLVPGAVIDVHGNYQALERAFE